MILKRNLAFAGKHAIQASHASKNIRDVHARALEFEKNLTNVNGKITESRFPYFSRKIIQTSSKGRGKII